MKRVKLHATFIYFTVFHLLLQIYGKSVENVRNHVDMRVAVNEKQSKKLIAKPNFKSFKIVNENLTLVTLSKTEVCLDKPISVGCAILDISKLIMYR